MTYILIGLLFGINIAQFIYFIKKFKSVPTIQVISDQPKESGRSTFSILYGER